MNVLLWVLQVLLAVWNLIGGIYVMSNYEMIANAWAKNLPGPIWTIYGALQVLFALGLLWPKLTPIAAIVLAVISLSYCVLSARYAGWPGILWGVIPALLLAFVAYERIAGR